MRFIGWEWKEKTEANGTGPPPLREDERCLAARLRRSHVAFCHLGPMREAGLFPASGGTFEPPAVKVGIFF
ncbi:hypothetical protein JAO77_00815 [Hymenobacter sp. BT559]|nr:hypothetical protein [Hymenobacter sp. BT559]